MQKFVVQYGSIFFLIIFPSCSGQCEFVYSSCENWIPFLFSNNIKGGGGRRAGICYLFFSSHSVDLHALLDMLSLWAAFDSSLLHSKEKTTAIKQTT
jgi:hypothetical protein